MIGRPPAGAMINRAHPLTRKIALMVPFLERSGSGFKDYLRKTQITPTSMSWANGCGRFDGSNSRLRLAANSNLAGTGSHSITVVFTHRGINAAGAVLFAKGSDGSGFGWGFCITTSATGQPIATAVTSGSQTSATGSTPLQIGKRYVLHGTFHSPTRALKIYANGQLAASATTAGTALRYANDSAIGCLFSSGYAVTNASNADIEMVVLRTYAMNQSEVWMEAANPYAAWEERPRRFYALSNNYTLDALTGAFVYTGQDAALTPALLMPADPGSYTLDGQDASLVEVAGASASDWIVQARRRGRR